jgi:hypothetical protein
VLVATALSGCADASHRTNGSCSPAFPSVAPASVPAGGLVTVTSTSWSGCRGSVGARYELWLGANSLAAFEHQGVKVAEVRVDRSGRFSVPVRIPSTTAPGPHTITVGRLPTDHERRGCDDGGSCGYQPSNVTMTAAP